MPDPTKTRRRSPGRALTVDEVAEAQALAARRAALLADWDRTEAEIRGLPWIREVSQPQAASALGLARATLDRWLYQ